MRSLKRPPGTVSFSKRGFAILLACSFALAGGCVTDLEVGADFTNAGNGPRGGTPIAAGGSSSGSAGANSSEGGGAFARGGDGNGGALAQAGSVNQGGAAGFGTAGADAGGTLGTGGKATGGSGATAGVNGEGGTNSSAGTAGTTGGLGGTGGCVVQKCGSAVTACGDCLDNDDDDAADAADPECHGACDEREDSFVTGKPPPGSCKLDCFFDNDNGGGNDGCDWSHTCDPLSVAPNYPPSGSSQCAATNTDAPECVNLRNTQSPECLEKCGPITPNGCDCFGCCELPSGTGKYVWLGSPAAPDNTLCTLGSVADPLRCRPCTPVVGCLNTCKPCEVCLGRPEPAPTCTSAEQECLPGQNPCGRRGQPDCASGSQCVTGCCVPRK